MVVTATELANESKSILDQVILCGEVVEVQRHGKTVAIIQPQVGVSRSELIRIMRNRGFTNEEAAELKSAMEAASEVIGYAGGD